MIRKFHAAVFVAIFMMLPTFVAPAYAQNEVTERSELIKIQNGLRLFREFEHDSRHLFFLMATAIISFEGGWMARDLAEGLSYAENLREVAKNQYLPKSNRFLARRENNKNLNDDEKARLAEVAEKMLELIALSKVIGDELDAGDGDAANTLFQEKAFPLFKSIWATNYTLISDAERRFPRR
jgi:hypothetical protein